MAANPAQTLLSTPIKSPAPPAVEESPGTWYHPRLQEIRRRREASTFTEKNINRIVVNVCLMFVLIVLHSLIEKALPPKRSASQIRVYLRYINYALMALPSANIFINILPLVRTKDDLSDIPLTPGQRRLMGLPPASGPSTPGSVYSTPPRYMRTPSASSSAVSRRSFPGSPTLGRSPSASNQRTPTPTGSGLAGSSLNGSLLASPSNQLLQRAMLGARRSSFGSASPLGVSISSGSSIFGPGPESPSPSAGGKRSSVGLNNKWRYNKGLYDRTQRFRDLDFESVHS
ncbi:nuclear pore complex component-domain-containing protein [Xylaria sp. CBS 124048]|nr:nuclear pore complex component-domain-containing protein [Xylaria sp. CBS 124048]